MSRNHSLEQRLRAFSFVERWEGGREGRREGEETRREEESVAHRCRQDDGESYFLASLVPVYLPVHHGAFTGLGVAIVRADGVDLAREGGREGGREGEEGPLILLFARRKEREGGRDRKTGEEGL